MKSDPDLFAQLDQLHAQLCAELDAPGTGAAKRQRIQYLAQQMFNLESDKFWRKQIAATFRLAENVLDLVDNCTNPADHDVARMTLRTSLQGLRMHIDSLRLRTSQ